MECRQRVTPQWVREVLAEQAPEDVATIGDAALLDRPLLGLVCSVRCPGGIILAAYDLAVALREAGVPVAGGFHSPMEREMLRLLLRGRQPVVVCPARGVAGMRVPTEWRGAIAEGRLVVASPFVADVRRATAQTSAARNRFVAALATPVLVVHAAPGGKTEALCREVSGWGKPLAALADPANAELAALGAQALRVEEVSAWWQGVWTGNIC